MCLLGNVFCVWKRQCFRMKTVEKANVVLVVGWHLNRFERSKEEQFEKTMIGKLFVIPKLRQPYRLLQLITQCQGARWSSQPNCRRWTGDDVFVACVRTTPFSEWFRNLGEARRIIWENLFIILKPTRAQRVWGCWDHHLPIPSKPFILDAGNPTKHDPFRWGAPYASRKDRKSMKLGERDPKPMEFKHTLISRVVGKGDDRFSKGCGWTYTSGLVEFWWLKILKVG